MKEVQDRVVQFSNRYKLTNIETGEVLGTFDFDEITGTVQQVGTEIDAELFDSIAADLAARVVSNGGELSGTIVTFSDISGTAANVASGDTSATLWGKVKNWFSRLKALAFKDKVSNTDVADDAAIAQSKISGLETALDAKANDADLAAIAKSGDLADATQDATHRVVTDTEKETWNAKQSALTFDSTPTANSTNPVTSEGVKTALDGKQPTITGAATSITNNNLTASRAVISDANGKVAVSQVTETELSYLDGVTENIQTQIDKIEDGTTTVGEAEHAKKNDYNLGAFDTYVDNGDGTVTVTRKTGRYDVPINNFIVSGDHFEQSISLPNGDTAYGTDTGYNANATSNVYKLAFYGINDSFYISGDNWLRIWDSSYTKDATGLAQFKAALEAAGGMYILYETTTSFTEKLAANVPINTLDANMSDMVREEVEKTLNLVDDSEGTLSAQGTAKYFELSPYCEVGKTYTITTYSSANSYGELRRSDESIVSFTNNNQNGSYSLTFTMVEGYKFNLYLTGAGSWTIMLVEGSNAYPYQPYNGAIVHEKQLNEALEDYLPLTGGTINGTINATGQVQEAGQRVYSPNNPQTTIAHANNATNATNIIPDENGAVNPLGRKADSVVGESSTALGRDSTASNTYSTALGRDSTASGAYSTALGDSAIASNTSSTALGDSAIASGAYSTALGFDTTASGSSSTALGRGATAEGDYSTALGRGAKALGDYSTALGDSAQVFSMESHTMQLGYSALSALRCKVNLTVTSDSRDKTDIEGITDALAFIERLNPVTFVSNERVDYISDEDKKGETFRTYGMCEYDRIAHAAGAKKGERRRCGLLAQEVIAVMQEVYGTDNYANIVNDNFHDLAEKPATVENKYTLAYANLVPFLIGAIKELSAKIKELEGKTTV